MIDSVMLYAILGALFLWGVFEVWVTGQSDD